MNPPTVRASLDPWLARYARQVLYEKIGVGGQTRLSSAQAVLFGCGALGSVIATTLVRAGLGRLRICDRDFIERDNLQRQVLFDEDDILDDLPKAQAAAAKLARINPEVTIEPHVIDVNPANIERLAEGAELLLDGTDNFETRFLINDLAVKTGRPWIYGAVVGTTGLMMAVIPDETPCLRCVFEEAPPPELNPTCDTAGVLGTAVNLVATYQCIEAIKILVGRREEVNRSLVSIDAWSGRIVHLNVQAARERGTCPCCCRRDFRSLDGRLESTTTTLCGRHAVQVRPGVARTVDFAAIAEKLAPVANAPVRHNDYMLKASVGDYELTLFPDGRAVIKGTDDPDKARTLCARFFGA